MFFSVLIFIYVFILLLYLLTWRIRLQIACFHILYVLLFHLHAKSYSMFHSYMEPKWKAYLYEKLEKLRLSWVNWCLSTGTYTHKEEEINNWVQKKYHFRSYCEFQRVRNKGRDLTLLMQGYRVTTLEEKKLKYCFFSFWFLVFIQVHLEH